MRNLLVNHSYLGTGDLLAPRQWLDRLAHPYRHQRRCRYRGKALTVRWTERARRALAARQTPLLVEMQLYFSCMVKKRVLFHSPHELHGSDVVTVNEHLQVTMRSVQADRCDPVEFARHYPGSRVLEAPAARQMRPSRLDIDFTDGQWRGVFEI